MEFTSGELYWLYRAVGQGRAGDNLADAEHRFRLRQLLEFTEEEKELIGLTEVERETEVWTFQFNGIISLERTLTERQAQKLLRIMEEVMPQLTGEVYALLRPALLRLGWTPPEDADA